MSLHVCSAVLEEVESPFREGGAIPLHGIESPYDGRILVGRPVLEDHPPLGVLAAISASTIAESFDRAAS